jgi:hypothetical protein
MGRVKAEFALFQLNSTRRTSLVVSLLLDNSEHLHRWLKNGVDPKDSTASDFQYSQNPSCEIYGQLTLFCA